MQIDFIVPAMKGEKPHPFTGIMKLEIPGAADRARMIKSIKYGPNAEGKIEELGAIDSSIVITELAKKHIVLVAVTHVATGKVFSSVDELECYKAGAELVSEASEMILGGMPLGEA